MNVKFDAYGFIEFDGVVYDDPEQARKVMLGDIGTPAASPSAALREEIREYDCVVSDGHIIAADVAGFGNVKAFIY